MAELATVATIASAGLSALGAIQAGNAQNDAAKFQAAQMEQQAGQERASAQRAMIEQRRKERFAQSRLQAVAAASGAGATDPTVLDLSGDIAQEGEYRALTALFEGEERARGLQMGASAKRYEGAAAKQAGYIGAATTMLGAGSSLYDKYGNDGPLPWQRAGNVRPAYMGGGYY